MPIKPFNIELAASQDENGVFVTLPVAPIANFPFVVLANGLKLWDDYSIVSDRLNLPENGTSWHISVSFWGESEDGLGTATGDFVTKDAMRTFSSYMMLGIQSAFGIQCTEADALLQAQQQSNDFQRQLTALKDSAVQREIEDTDEYKTLIAQNESLLAIVADLRTRTYSNSASSGATIQIPSSDSDSDNDFYVADFWAGVTESEVEIKTSDNPLDLVERLRGV